MYRVGLSTLACVLCGGALAHHRCGVDDASRNALRRPTTQTLCDRPKTPEVSRRDVLDISKGGMT
jgi:hypothetical protein